MVRHTGEEMEERTMASCVEMERNGGVEEQSRIEGKRIKGRKKI